MGLALQWERRLVTDVDSTITKVCNTATGAPLPATPKSSAINSLVAVRAETGEILGIRMR